LPHSLFIRIVLLGIVLNASLLSITINATAQAASESDWRACRDVDNAIAADRNIESCDRILSDSNQTAANRVAALTFRCGLWFTKRTFDRGLADCNRALEIDPNYALAYNSRGNNWRGKGEQDRAIADYNDSLRLNPRPIVYNNRGLSWRAKGDLDRAIADFDRTIELDPRIVFPYVNRGSILREIGALVAPVIENDGNF
jgi:tetratricopeptide (TPR) repeat protein